MILRAPEHRFESSLFIPRDVATVWPFFTSENNLERITPPWLGFKVIGKSTPEIGAGTLIDYRISLNGIPMRWRTRIETWEPGRRFVDNQLKGPYALWHHTHTFTPENGGTRMDDVVRFRLPFGRLGDLVAGWKVKRQVAQIFAYRTQVITREFGVDPARSS